MDFNDILIYFLTLYVILMHVADKNGRDKIWRVLDKIRGPVSQLYCLVHPVEFYIVLAISSGNSGLLIYSKA
jgi:hypothetical protein